MIHTEIRGAFVFATLASPGTRNALNEGMVAELLEAIARSEALPEVRALVVRGGSGHFCAGGDFSRFRDLMATPAPQAGVDPIATFNRAFGSLLERLQGATVVTIAVVEGAAMGGGVGLAACCDFVLAGSSSRVGIPEVTLGLPPAQIAPFVAARLGEGPARRLMLTGRRLQAEEALACGLADEVVDDAAMDLRLNALLTDLGRAEPAALRATKAILQHRRSASLPDTLDFAASHFAASLRSGTASEGLAALSGKRTARWVVQAPAANIPADDGPTP